MQRFSTCSQVPNEKGRAPFGNPALCSSSAIRSWPDGDLQNVVPAVAEEVIGRADLVEREPVRDERQWIEATRLHHPHQASHALLAARAQRRDDRLIAETRCEGLVRDLELARVDAQA